MRLRQADGGDAEEPVADHVRNQIPGRRLRPRRPVGGQRLRTEPMRGRGGRDQLLGNLVDQSVGHQEQPLLVRVGAGEQVHEGPRPAGDQVDRPAGQHHSVHDRLPGHRVQHHLAPPRGVAVDERVERDRLLRLQHPLR